MLFLLFDFVVGGALSQCMKFKMRAKKKKTKQNARRRRRAFNERVCVSYYSTENVVCFQYYNVKFSFSRSYRYLSTSISLVFTLSSPLSSSHRRFLSGVVGGKSCLTSAWQLPHSCATLATCLMIHLKTGGFYTTHPPQMHDSLRLPLRLSNPPLSPLNV